MLNLRSPRGEAIVALGAALASLALASPAAATPLRQAKLPRTLVVLEQRMKSLHVNSERGRMVEYLTGVSLSNGGSLLNVLEDADKKLSAGRTNAVDAASQLPITAPLNATVLTADFEASASPRLLALRGELFGVLPFQLRVVGGDEYVRDPIVLPANGSKHWISKTAAPGAAGEAEVPGTLPISGSGAESAKLIASLAKAQSVVEVGPVAVDGQQTTEFKATLTVKGSGAAAGRSSSRRPRARETLYLYLAADGLPVRTRVRAQVGKESAYATTDVLATEVPVSVTPPPASETISEAELEKSEESSGGGSPETLHLTKREQAEQRRLSKCMSRRLSKDSSKAIKRQIRKVVRECERIAKAGAK